MSSKINFSSRPVIAGILILFILFLSAGGWFYYRGLKSSTLEKNHEYLNSIASAKGKAVTAWFQKEENLLRDYFRGNLFYEKRRGRKGNAWSINLYARLNTVLNDVNAVSCALYNSKEKFIAKAGSEANIYADELPPLTGKTFISEIISIERIKDKTYAEAIIPLQRMKDDVQQSAYAVVRISLEPFFNGELKHLPGYYSSEEAALYSPAQTGNEWLIDITSNKFYNAGFISERKSAGGSLFNSMIEGINTGTDQKKNEVISSSVKIGGSGIFFICKANISDLEDDVKIEGTKIIVFVVSVSLMLFVIFIYLFTGKKKTQSSVQTRTNTKSRKKEQVKVEEAFDASEIQNDFVFEAEKNAVADDSMVEPAESLTENAPAEPETVEIVEPAEPAEIIPTPEEMFINAEENEAGKYKDEEVLPRETKKELSDDEIVAAIAGVMETANEQAGETEIEEKNEEVLPESEGTKNPVAEELPAENIIEETVPADEPLSTESAEIEPVRNEDETVKEFEPESPAVEIVQEEIKEEAQIVEEESKVQIETPEQEIKAVEENISESEPEPIPIEPEGNETIVSEEEVVEEPVQTPNEVIEETELSLPPEEAAEPVIESEIVLPHEIPVSGPYKELEEVEIPKPGISNAMKESLSESDEAINSDEKKVEETEKQTDAPLIEEEPEEKEELELVEGKLVFAEKPFVLTEYQKPKREITSKLDGIKGFGLIPKILFEINLLLKKEPDNRAKLANVIIKEQSLTTKLLAVANSPYYGLKKKVTSIEYALLLLGTEEVCRLVTALSLSDAVRFPSTTHLRYLDYWYHSMVVGFTARDIASKLGFHEIVNDVFLGGIFHDLGIQILAKYFPKEFEIIATKTITGESALVAELETIGSTHQEIGRYAAEKWGLPDVIFDAIGFHHSPEKSESGKIMAGIINLSDWMVHQVTERASFWDNGAELDGEIYKILGFKSIEARNTFLEDYYPALHATLGAIHF